MELKTQGETENKENKWKQKSRIVFPKEDVENTDLSKPVMRKTITTQD